MRDSQNNIIIREVVDALNHPVIVLDKDREIIVISKDVEVGDYTVDKEIKENPLGFILRNIKGKERRENIEESIIKGENWEGEIKVLDKNKSEISLNIKISHLRHITGIVLTIEDTTKLKNMEKKLRHKESALEDTINAAVLTDIGGEINYVNSSFMKMWGIESIDDIKGETIYSLIGDSTKVCKIQRELSNKGSWEGELQLENPSGEIREVLSSITLVKDDEGKGVCYIFLSMDITQRKVMERRLESLSYEDALTGLYNRAFFEDALIKLDREENLPLSVIMGDVNGLKMMNDTFGHKEGDKLLVNIAQILSKSTRSKDIVCRWGGDEYAIILPNTDKEIVELVSKRIKENCKNSRTEYIEPSISMGYATKEDINEDIEEVIQKAEKGLYRNKLIESKSARGEVLETLKAVLAEKSYETEEHSKRLGEIVMILGDALKLSSSDLDTLQSLASLHDIGKIVLPDEITNNIGRLDEEQFELMKTHPEVGYRIAKASPETAHLANDILQHHERWDGEGYPSGLKGNEISLFARIIAIADAYEVMTRGRPYQKALTHSEAIEEIVKCSGKQFDPKIVNIFKDLDVG